MTRIVTYSLRLGARNSDDYYRAIAHLADAWTAHAVRAMRDVIASFRLSQQEMGLDRGTDADPERAFELLVLGVLLREHGAQALRAPQWWTRVMGWLAPAQERWPHAEGVIKAALGWVGWLGRRKSERFIKGDPVAALVAWLRANGEDSQANRLSQWQDYFGEIGPAPTRRIIARCLILADEFAAESAPALGPYTQGVERFLSEAAPRYRRRYDAEFVARTRLEYHLGMLGTEVLSRAYRARFLAAGRKVVIVPPCMRAQPEDKCKAVQTPLGAKCQACTPTCRVHQVTRLGEKHGFEVYIIPDALRGIGAAAGRAVAGLGLVGVSCALTNWPGGWEADAQGVPAQGVLLDYVGCQYHWDPEGITTDTNLRKLEEVLGLREISPSAVSASGEVATAKTPHQPAGG
jgi:hypothetical protein